MIAAAKSDGAKNCLHWLRKFPNEKPERMAIIFEAVAAYDACIFNAEVSQADLQPIVNAAMSPYTLVFEVGCNFLGTLAEMHEPARQCWLAMARAKLAPARWHAVAYLETHLPESLRREVLSLALYDKSSVVREKGVEKAWRFKFKDLLPQLDAILLTEKHPGVRESLEFYIPLLRDGYFVAANDDGSGYWLTVGMLDGGIAGRFILAEEYSDDYVRGAIAELRDSP